MKTTLHEDCLLLSAIEKRDKKAFDTLFRKYYSALCAYCTNFVKLEDAEEIVQDVLLWIWRHPDAHTIIETSLSKYLFKMVYHKAISQLRQQSIRQRVNTVFYEQMQDMLHDIDLYQIKELAKHIEQAIKKLPPNYQEAFCMHRFKGMSYKEIASILDVSPKTVDYRIQQALKILRGELKDYLPIILLLLTAPYSSS